MARPQHTSSSKRRAAKPRHRITVSGVIGEILITLGVLLLGFIGWKFWLNDYLIGQQEIAESGELSQQLAQEYETVERVDPDEQGIPVRPLPTEESTPYGVMYVPAWGEDYSRRMAAGIDRGLTLNHAFVGTYMDSTPPGGVGNMAIAAHRITYGGAFLDLDQLKLGDKMYIETVDGWYTYEYRSAEYVEPSATDVLEKIPHHPELPAEERFLTVISCNPYWTMDERIILYFTLTDFNSRDDGPPAEIEHAYNLRVSSGGQDHGGEGEE